MWIGAQHIANAIFSSFQGQQTSDDRSENKKNGNFVDFINIYLICTFSAPDTHQAPQQLSFEWHAFYHDV